MKKQELIEEIEFAIKGIEKQISDNKAKLDKDYEYYFSWVGLEQWQLHFRAKYLKGLLETIITEYDLTAKQVVERAIEGIEDFVLKPYNIRELSTNPISNEVSSAKVKSFLSILEWLKGVKKRLK